MVEYGGGNGELSAALRRGGAGSRERVRAWGGRAGAWPDRGLTGHAVSGVQPPRGVRGLTRMATHGEVSVAISARWKA